uniref:Uncharacterized protein n=1 Tax=Fagus sylvatica TaxID=28930 RepID=A0A2N9HV43_FAGSY
MKIPVKRGMLSANLRVPRRSWSRYLSNAPGLADQLVASRKDSAREGGFPDVGFRRSWYRRKACVAYFCKVPDLRKSELGLVRYGPANRGHRSVFGPFEGSFPIRIPARPGKILAIREFLVVHECVFFPTCPGLADQLVASQEDSARKCGNVGGKIPELSAKPYFVGLFSRACFDHNFLVSRPFLARKVSNRSSHHVLQNGQGAVSLIQLSVWSTIRSNLGQTWSNLVKVLQILGNVSRTTFRGFLIMVGPYSGWKRPSQTWSNPVKLGQTESNLVNPSQIWSNLGKCVLDLLLGSISIWRGFVRSCWLGPGCPVLLTDTRENPVGKNGVMTTREFPKLPRFAISSHELSFRIPTDLLQTLECPFGPRKDWHANQDELRSNRRRTRKPRKSERAKIESFILCPTFLVPRNAEQRRGNCHNPIFTHEIFSGVGTQNGTTQTEPA